MTNLNKVEMAELAMMLEVTAWTKPGNIDRHHDYPDTRLQHFLASILFVRQVFEKAANKEGSIGDLIKEATILSMRQNGGNTHFGAFILLIPLLMGDGIEGARSIVKKTTIEDAISFYEAFGYCDVRVNECDELDINDPKTIKKLREKGMTLYDVMAWSDGDMVAAEWVNGFELTRITADIIKRSPNFDAIPQSFIILMAAFPDTFIGKKFGMNVAEDIQNMAEQVINEDITIDSLDEHCLALGINPGSLADIFIAGLFVAILEGWKWDVPKA